MARRVRIHEQFSSYRREVIPAHAPQVQVEECRRAFYAGAVAMQKVLLDIADLDDTNPEEGIRQLSDLDTEIAAFPLKVLSEDRP